MFFFDRAFRSFFLGASLFSVLAMLLWFWQTPIYTHLFSGVVPLYWHAHEMVFGYALATVTGFLLTAVMNWTGMSSASGKSLMLLFVLWLAARIGYLVDMPIEWVAVLDLSFGLGLFLHFAIPVFRKKLWVQTGLASKFLLIWLANGAFYLGAMGVLPSGEWIGVLLGLFLVLGINLTMMRRLIPFFTEKALGLPDFQQSKWLDGLALGGFLVLMVCATFWPTHWVTSLVAFPLFIIHAIRFKRWYHPGIWTILLLWPLYFSYGFMIFGMALYGFVGLDVLNASIALHALAVGGIGLLCSSIMARISLGHTQRNVFEPPKGIIWVFVILAVSAVIRVILPILFPEFSTQWMQTSQLGWAMAFLLLSVIYWPILARPHSPKSGLQKNGALL